MYEEAKIREAQHFLSLLPGLQNDREKFIYNLSACITAARSALQYARKEADGKRRGLRWYDRHVAKSKVIPFLKCERNLNVHERPISPSAGVSVRAPAQGALSPAILIAVIRADGTIEKHNVGEQGPRGGLNPSEATVALEYFFPDWPGKEDVIKLCTKYLDEVEAIVADGVKRGFLTP